MYFYPVMYLLLLNFGEEMNLLLKKSPIKELKLDLDISNQPYILAIIALRLTFAIIMTINSVNISLSHTNIALNQCYNLQFLTSIINIASSHKLSTAKAVSHIIQIKILIFRHIMIET